MQWFERYYCLWIKLKEIIWRKCHMKGSWRLRGCFLFFFLFFVPTIKLRVPQEDFKPGIIFPSWCLSTLTSNQTEFCKFVLFSFEDPYAFVPHQGDPVCLYNNYLNPLQFQYSWWSPPKLNPFYLLPLYFAKYLVIQCIT